MKNHDSWHIRDIRRVAVAASFLLSGFMMLSGWIPNEDAFTYLRTIEIFNAEGLVAAYAHYPWATYAILVALVENLTGLDPLLAAVTVNACFYGVLVYAFISIVAELDDSRRTLVMAAIVVLVYPQLNENRLIIIRDSAFWALGLVGLWQFLCYRRTDRLGNALGFSAAFLLAALFRVEALAFLFFIPLCLITDSRPDRSRRWLAPGIFTVGALAVLALATAFGFMAGLSLPQLFSDQLSTYLPFVRETLAPEAVTSARLGRAVFGEYAANFSGDYLPLFMFAGFLAVLLAFVFRSIGGPFLIIMVAGALQKHWRIPRWQLMPLLMTLLVNLLIAMTFLIATRFLSSRYVMFGCLVAVLFVPLLLVRIQRRADRDHQGKLTGRLIGLLLVYCAIDAYISFGTDKGYVREAGQWIAANSQAQTELLTNNRIVAFYSQRIEAYDQVPILLSASEILGLPSGALIAFEEDISSVGLFSDTRLVNAVEEVTSIGPEPGRQIVIYRRR